MKHRVLPLALLIAASVSPLAGCGNDSADTQSNDLAAEQSQQDPAGGDNSPLPVNDPNDDAASGGDAAGAQAPSGDDTSPDRARLEQQVQALLQTTRQQTQRLDDQEQRIKALSGTVADLKTRLRRLPQPTGKATDAQASDRQSDTPAAVSPQADADSDDDASSSDGGSPSPPDADIVTDCDKHTDDGHQFDVFFQGQTSQALAQAQDAVQSAHLSDWFVATSLDRLYVGRYNRCPTAAHRRDDVSSRTGLDLFIAAVLPHAHATTHHASHPAHRQASHPAARHDYGSDDQMAGNDAPQTAEPAAINRRAPFQIIGVELRGEQQYLGVSSPGDTRLADVVWLTPGEQFGGWQLREIRTDTGRAIFQANQTTIVVGLPSRG